MKRQSILLLLAALMALCIVAPASAVVPTTTEYADYSGSANWFSTHFADQFGGETNVPVWDLTKGDLVLTYTLDMSKITQPHGLPANPTEWEAYVGPTAKDPSNYPDSYTPYIEVGLRGEGAGDFNPGPFGVYQGRCGGWMVSECDDWVGYWDNGVFVGDGTEIQDLDDKHGLQASGGRSELDYDVLKSTPDTVDSIPSPYWWYPSPKGAYGSWDNHGLWFDRDGVDQWQATSWGNSGENAGRINTGGVYTIEITYHAIDANNNGDKTDDGLGVMFAKINGVQQGFYTTWVSGAPQYYPVGMSFKGDMEHMQVFAGSYAGDPSGWNYGTVTLSKIQVTGTPGVADPLVPDFTSTVVDGVRTFDASATHGGMGPYTYKWDWNSDGTVDDTTTSPTIVHNFVYPQDKVVDNIVTLTVEPYRCTPKSVTKYQWILRKDVLLYWDSHNIAYSDPETEFTVEMFRKETDGSFTSLGQFTVSESHPFETWLGTGEYKFVEVSVPDGYTPAREFWYITEAGGPGHRDMSFENLIRFDLAVEKTGPTSAHPGDIITYSYTVTNAGPAAVTPVLSDDHGTPADTSDDVAPTYVSGDTNSDGKIQSTETWKYTATYTVPAGAAGTSIVNVATVVEEASQGWTPGEFYVGGDTDLTDNTDTWTIPVTSVQTGYLLPTQTSVQMYAGDPSLWPPMYSNFAYTLKSGKINSISPGVIFYYNTITAPGASFVLTVTQTNTNSWKPMLVQQDSKKLQAYLYDANFNIVKVGTSSGTNPYVVTFTVAGATPGAPYYIGIKYSPSNLVGIAPTGGTSTYSFATTINGGLQAGSAASIPVVKK